MQLVYTHFCNMSSEILQNKDKNAGFLIKVAKNSQKCADNPCITRYANQKRTKRTCNARPYKVT